MLLQITNKCLMNCTHCLAMSNIKQKGMQGAYLLNYNIELLGKVIDKKFNCSLSFTQ